MRRGFTPIIVIFILIGILIFGAAGYLYFQNRIHQNWKGEANATSSLTQALACSSDLGQLMTIPPLFPGLTWSVVTSSSEFPETMISSSTGVLTYLDPLTLEPDSKPWKHPLEGQEWNASWSSQDMWSNFYDYYESQLKKDYWSPEIDISGYKIFGIDASGIGSENGFIKIQNGRLRAIVLEYGKINGQQYFNVFVSNITSLSQIIPSYQLNCADSGTATPIGGPY